MKKIILSIFSVLLVLSCENGLIGLGERIDIDSPGITIGSYTGGSPISNADYAEVLLFFPEQFLMILVFQL